MKYMISLLLFIICVTNICGEETVKYAAIIFRHGDRTPVSTYPKDPYKDETLWPVKFGQLTNIGKMQHYVFGTTLRKRFSQLVSKKFDPEEIYVRSTDVDRTLMSAQANLAGFYPPTGPSVWNNDLMWQPIPVHTVPEVQDDLLAMKKPCPVFDKELSRYKQTLEYKNRLRKYQPLMNFLSISTGINVRNYDDMMDIYSTLYIEKLYNFTLPKWTMSVYPHIIREPACYSFTTQTATPLLARLKVGPILKFVTSHMVNVMHDTTGKHPKLHMFSAHDLNIGSILNAMGLYDGNCPCYTSAIFFELLVDDASSEHFVRVSYRNTTGIREPVVLEIPNCGTKCPLDRFTELYNNLITVSWEYECNREFPPLLILSFAVGLFIFVSIYILHKMHFARVYHQQRSHQAYADILTTTIIPLKLVDD